MSKLSQLIEEGKKLLEQEGGGGGPSGVGTGTAPSASGVTIGGAPAGGAPGMPYMGSSFSAGADQLGTTHKCSGCGAACNSGGPCPNCGLRSFPLRAIGVPVGSFPKKKRKKKHHKKKAKAGKKSAKK